jgi:hypothetical protein
MNESLSFEVVCPNTHNQTGLSAAVREAYGRFTEAEFEFALSSIATLCHTNSHPSGKDIALFRRNFARHTAD